jgi:non-ribosomal peptide synthetase-like protein
MSRALRRDTATLPLFDETPSLLQDFFEVAAARWPDRIAVEIPPGRGRPERRTVTYAELKREADRICQSLRPAVSGESIVAILLPRTTELLCAAQLGVLKAGAAHLSLDPAFPDGHLATILADSGAVALVTDAAGRERAGRAGFSVPHLVDAPAEARPRGRAAPSVGSPRWLAPQCLAYAVYTSGTTGKPKGVLIEHRGVANLVASDLAEFTLAPGDRVAQGSSASYDSSVEEIWLALAAGATVVVMDDEAARLGPDLIPWLRAERITVLCPPPTLLRTTASARPQDELPDLRLVYVGGEALPRDVADRWADGWRLENGYGPTECTVTAIRTRIQRGGEISIGRPVPRVTAFVLNEDFEEVPDGETGELCLGGAGLARGYHNLPDLTAERFPVHPKLGRIYRTGDLARRAPDGTLFCLGRIDHQVKLRGYRIELEEIEARLAECPGVLEAACRVQGEGARQTLAAFVVPASPDAPPSTTSLRSSLERALPSYMVPARIGVIAALPKTVGGKIDRLALPPLPEERPESSRPAVLPRTALEETIVAAFREALEIPASVSVEDDFFDDLGGDSLAAALVISRLRDDPATASLAARDLYDAPTAAGLAERAGTGAAAPDSRPRERAAEPGDPALATLGHAAAFFAAILAGSAAGVAAVSHLLPALLSSLGLTAFLLLAPALAFLALLLWVPVSVALTALAKRLLVGTYRPGRFPVWGSLCVRSGIVRHAARLIPWKLLEGTEFQIAALRALGAQIGERVHLHRGVNLTEGGWDLLSIGDDVTVGQEVALQLVELEDGHLVFGEISIGDGATIDVHASVEGDAVLEAGSFLSARSCLARGERIQRGELWDGIPARPAGLSPDLPALTHESRKLSSGAYGALALLLRFALFVFRAVPATLAALLVALERGLDTARALAWLAAPALDLRLLLTAMAALALTMPVMLLFEAAACRLLGRVRKGVFPLRSFPGLRIALKVSLVESAGRWLWGTLLWPVWLRLAGARIGKGCEISSLYDTLPDLLSVGEGTFCADGIYLGGPRIHRGTVSVDAVRLGSRSFFGNGVVVAGGAPLPDDVLLGVCTVADSSVIEAGTSWFGHPSFELPRRQVVEADPSLTLHPSPVRYANRVIWEWLRFALPALPVALAPAWWLLVAALRGLPSPVFALLALPLATLAVLLLPALLVVALKWLLLGRVAPGTHPLWSCFASRWDFVCMAWNIWAGKVATALDGSLLLPALLRLAGVTIGRNVALGSAFAEDLPDPDMLTIEDGATFDGIFQAHTFEDRVLKLDRITIRRDASVGRNAVLLYGADIGAGARVAPNSVVMKHERLLPGRSYAGFPVRAV